MRARGECPRPLSEPHGGGAVSHRAVRDHRLCGPPRPARSGRFLRQGPRWPGARRPPLSGPAPADDRGRALAARCPHRRHPGRGRSPPAPRAGSSSGVPGSRPCACSGSSCRPASPFWGAKLALDDVAVPRVATALRAWGVGEFKVDTTTGMTGGDWYWLRSGPDILRISAADAAVGQLRRVSIFERDGQGLLLTRIDAATARSTPEGLILSDVVRSGVGAGPSQHLVELRWPDRLDLDRVRLLATPPRELPAAQLVEILRAGAYGARPAEPYATALYARLAGAFVPGLLLMLAFALGRRFSRTGSVAPVLVAGRCHRLFRDHPDRRLECAGRARLSHPRLGGLPTGPAAGGRRPRPRGQPSRPAASGRLTAWQGGALLLDGKAAPGFRPAPRVREEAEANDTNNAARCNRGRRSRLRCRPGRRQAQGRERAGLSAGMLQALECRHEIPRMEEEGGALPDRLRQRLCRQYLAHPDDPDRQGLRPAAGDQGAHQGVQDDLDRHRCRGPAGDDRGLHQPGL